jgi:hypothetical protein
LQGANIGDDIAYFSPGDTFNRRHIHGWSMMPHHTVLSGWNECNVAIVVGFIYLVNKRWSHAFLFLFLFLCIDIMT